ncbi:T3SS effector HopA1 family protein [Sphingomonas qilianensis]|uniref:T3SS effector HopA1 family protein n=1 Tax=Sphingomonas qilianensis TaxID=1736690 RepID=A0ABU9XU49_9SPHN
MIAEALPSWFGIVQPILDAVRIVSSTGFTFEGTLVDAARQPPPSPDDDFFDPDPLMRTLHRRLYGVFHACAGGGGDVGKRARAAFVERLSAANRGRSRLDEGWSVVETLASGAVVAEKWGRTRRCNPGEFLSDAAPARVTRGAALAIRLRHAAPGLQPGFCYAFGGDLEDGFDRLRSVRYYFNIDAAAAPAVVALITQEFGARAIPFACKCADTAGGFARRDPCVLYVGARHAQLVHGVLRAMLPRLAPHLRPPVPIFTELLAPGLAFAEEPAGRDSFGGHRMRAVAYGLIAAHARGAADDAARGAAILHSFAQHSIDRNAPHLSASDSDPFGLRCLRFADAA